MTARKHNNFFKQVALATLLYLALVGLILVLGFSDNKVNKLEFRQQTYKQVFGVEPKLPKVEKPKESRRPSSQTSALSVPEPQLRASC